MPAIETDVGMHRLVGFGRYLRAHGLAVGTGRILTFCRAAVALDPFDRTDLRLAAGATLVSRPGDRAVLDELFDAYFGDVPPEAPVPPTPGARAKAERARSAEDRVDEASAAAKWSQAAADEETEGEGAIRVVASEAELLRRKDFAELSEAERGTVLALVRQLTVAFPKRRSRRYRSSPEGVRFDLRRTLRLSLRTEGEPFRRAWRTRQIRQRPLVLVLDVSGSMAPYSRTLVEFAHAAAASGRRVEVFCFGTRLTRITRAVRTRDPGAALAAVAQAVHDWEGGTRIGESLRELLDGWGGRSALRGSVIVLCSDGLERGDPELLFRQMQRLSRLSHRLVWVNPLKGSPRYEPLARGMSVSLPFVDVFLPGHNLESLEALAEVVALA